MKGPEIDGALQLVAARIVLGEPIAARFPLRPGERAIVAPGEAVQAGTLLAERLRDPRTDVVVGPSGSAGEPGTWWVASPTERSRRGGAGAGELLFRSGGRWRVGTGEPGDPLESPFAGIVREVVSGSGIVVETSSPGLLGVAALGGPSTGRLHVLAARDGHVRASEIDVGAAGAILVVGSHVDAEAITRARALGVRGIVVGGLGMKERHDILASERRGRAAVHGLPPFAILVLEGTIGRPIASPLMAVLEAAAGRAVSIVADPPCLVIDGPLAVPRVPPGHVRVTSGPLAGVEGAWAGLAGLHRFSGGVQLEAGFVRLGGRPPVVVPLGDLERFA